MVAIADAVILALIVIFSIRERRYEIGVLMSLGENRLKIIGQFFTELFMVTIVSLVTASFAGNFVGNALVTNCCHLRLRHNKLQTKDLMAVVLVKRQTLLMMTISKMT